MAMWYGGCEMSELQYGTLIPAEIIGVCTYKVNGLIADDDATYMCASGFDGTLYIVSGRTGKGFALDAQDALALAKAAGIDKPDGDGGVR